MAEQARPGNNSTGNSAEGAEQYFMRSERLGFRLWSERDADLAAALWGDPRVAEFIVAGGRMSRELAMERLNKEIALAREHGGLQYWPMFLLETGEPSASEAERHVGCCGLRPYDPANGVLELGFHVRPEHWGRGFASEAARAVMALGFDALGARGLFAGHHPKNEASRRLLLKLGFRHVRDELYPPTGLLHPSYMIDAAEERRLRQADSRPA